MRNSQNKFCLTGAKVYWGVNGGDPDWDGFLGQIVYLEAPGSHWTTFLGEATPLDLYFGKMLL